MEDSDYVVITGGTLVHVAPHFALCAPAYGQIGEQIAKGLRAILPNEARVVRVRTKMALGDQAPSTQERRLYEAAGIGQLETNADLRQLVDHLVAEPRTRAIIMSAAVCDFEPARLEQGSDRDSRESFGKTTPRLSSAHQRLELTLRPSEKIVARIRRQRKDVFLVAFKATSGATREQCYGRGLALLKRVSANLVFANDVRAHENMVITPEEFPYFEKDRKRAVRTLCELIRDRTRLSFVRTTVRDEPRADLLELERHGAIPSNFVTVLRHLIERGAYKPFLGKTSGHFGCRVLDASLGFSRVSSIRKVDHNRALSEGVAKIHGYQDGRIVAGGAKPSVGEHTQHRIYELLGDRVDSIVHFHCPLRANAAALIPSAPQRPFECGSVECAENTARHMAELAPGIFAVQLDGHGPNIAFSRDVSAEDVIQVIERSFDLADKTGGLLPSALADESV